MMFPSYVQYHNRFIRTLDYALSPTPNDDNAVTPYYLDLIFSLNETKIEELFSEESVRIRHLNGSYYLLYQYNPDEFQRIILVLNSIGFTTISKKENFFAALPWLGIEIQNMEANIFNEQVQPEFESDVCKLNFFNEACELLFEHLNFFDLAKLQRVSSHFLKPIFKRLFVYSNRKSDLFLNFDLSEFLRKIDDGKVDQTRKFITIYEFRFIIRHFGHQMENIRVQTDCLKFKLNKNIDDPINYDFENIIEIVCDILYDFIDNNVCKAITIDYLKMRDAENSLPDKRHKSMSVMRDLNYFKYNKMLHTFDMSYYIDDEWLQMLAKKRYLKDFSILTDYPNIERSSIIEVLKKMRLEKYCITSHNDMVNKNCDDLLEALLHSSSESLLELSLKGCHSDDFISVINRFANLEVLNLENVSLIRAFLVYKLSLPKVVKLQITNCCFVDDSFCYNYIRKHKSLKYLDVSKCGSVAGTFLRELDAQLNDNLFEMDELEINITNTPAGYLVNRGEILITNEKLKIKNENKKKYSDDEISLIIGDLCDLSDLSINECFDLASNHEVPLSFKRILLEFQNDLHLNLLNYCHLSENCLKFISSLRNIRKLTINTYYPKLNFEKITKVLNNYEIPEIAILGYNTDDADERNSLNSMLIGIEDYSATHLTSLEFSNCSIGPGMIKILNKFTNLTSLTFSKVRVLLEQSFDSLCLPKVETIALHECSEVDDVLCNKILKSFPNVKSLKLFKCMLIEGTFLREIYLYIPLKAEPLNVTITEGPAVLNYWRGQLQPNYVALSCHLPPKNVIENGLHLMKIVLGTKLRKDVKKHLLGEIFCIDLSDRMLRDASLEDLNKLSSNLHHLINLQYLVISSFYQKMPKLGKFNKLKIGTLEIINDELHEKDLTAGIIKSIQFFNPDFLHTIMFKKCAIDIQCIVALNRLKRIETLSFDTVSGLSNSLVKKISLKRITKLDIINNDELNDKTCLHIVNKCSPHLFNLCVYNCQSITEVILKELCALEFIRARFIYLDISGTPAGYHYILNPNKYSFDNCVIRNNSYETHLAYMKRILLDSKTVSSLPVELISMFQTTDQLDLTDSLPNLNDLSFELISQLDKLRRVKMFSHYRNVSDRQQMVKNISNLNLERLTIEGNNEPDCEDIIEAIAARKPNDLLEISIRNCTITTTLLEFLNKFRNLHVIMISNENGNYLRTVLEEFEFSTSPVYNIYVNDRLIENNKVFLENIRRSVLNRTIFS